MCSKDTALDNAARSLEHDRLHCRHAREAVTAYRHNRKDDSKPVYVSTDDSRSLHAQQIQFGAASQIWVSPPGPMSFRCNRVALHHVRSLLMPSLKGNHKSQVAVTSDNRNGA